MRLRENVKQNRKAWKIRFFLRNQLYFEGEAMYDIKLKILKIIVFSGI